MSKNALTLSVSEISYSKIITGEKRVLITKEKLDLSENADCFIDDGTHNSIKAHGAYRVQRFRIQGSLPIVYGAQLAVA